MNTKTIRADQVHLYQTVYPYGTILHPHTVTEIRKFDDQVQLDFTADESPLRYAGMVCEPHTEVRVQRVLADEITADLIRFWYDSANDSAYRAAIEAVLASRGVLAPLGATA